MKKVIRNNLQMLRYIWKQQKIIFFVAALFCLCDILSPIEDTYLPKLIIDCLYEHKSFRQMVPLILFLLAIALYKAIIWPLYKNYFSPIAKVKISKALNVEMMHKTKKLDLKCFENEEFYNQYTRALNELDERAYKVFESLVAFLRYLLYISVLVGIIVKLDSMLIIFSVTCAAISIWANKKVAKLSYEFNNGLTSAQRKCDYTKRILYIPEYAKETRAYPMTDLLISKFKKYTDEKIVLYKSNGKKITIASILPEIVTTLCLQGVVVAYLIYKIINGALTPGDFIALFLATLQFSNQLTGLGNQLNDFYANSLYVDNINKVFGYEPEIEGREGGGNSSVSFQEIAFKNVSFTYEDVSQKQALDKINLKIKKGEKIAVVGLNGSGKSTLIKLLLNLYNPSQGRIELNGEDIKKYPVREYRNIFGIIFQDYHSLSFSISDNILFKEGNEEERGAVKRALDRTGMLKKVEKLKFGIDTPISRELFEDGTMFSGGELQSIMLSRLFLKAYDILILDEPTSALDAYAEYLIYEELFSKKHEDQTAIIISHQLIATRNADIIYYMENGKIMESGSHDELMQLNGKYAQLYNIQRNYYDSEQASEEFKENVGRENSVAG